MNDIKETTLHQLYENYETAKTKLHEYLVSTARKLLGNRHFPKEGEILIFHGKSKYASIQRITHFLSPQVDLKKGLVEFLWNSTSLNIKLSELHLLPFNEFSYTVNVPTGSISNNNKFRVLSQEHIQKFDELMGIYHMNTYWGDKAEEELTNIIVPKTPDPRLRLPTPDPNPPPNISLNGLPSEAFESMMSVLNIFDICSLAGTCKTAYETTHTPQLWRTLIARDRKRYQKLPDQQPQDYRGLRADYHQHFSTLITDIRKQLNRRQSEQMTHIERSKLLHQELKRYKCNLRSDSQLGQKYINGSIVYRGPREIATIIAGVKRLFDIGGPEAYSENHKELDNFIRDSSSEFRKTYEEALEEFMDEVVIFGRMVK